ncbi:protein bric-a-brac 2-like isoform X3 [Penaeus chinensis]|uniref:protein bric-a-brac 2-like isoform X3 n=1 Tax=Penaeus chinensis TaxID=139456 RepID=UPI001FB820AD|nr:protein bric-a-brac 2-like isoform X3 [Penaeus chinensis]
MDIEHERGIKKKNQFVMSGTPPAAAGGGGGAAAVAAAAADHFCLRWNNYQTNMTAVFDQLLQEEVFVDVTLSCEGGQQLRAHKVVLAACSPYFQAVLQNNPCKHPIVILPRDVAFADLRAIIEFVYRGEIDVAQEQINSLLAAADTLKIKGLCEVGDDPTHVPPGFTATPSSASRHAASASSSGGLNASSSGSSHTPRGRGSYTRGRYNTSYRPRGRPPLYGRHRYERPSPNAPRSNDHHDHPNSSKRIKLESTEEDGHGNAGGGGEEGDGSVQQRPSHHPHYVHNGTSAPHAPSAHATSYGPRYEGAGTSHGGADYDGTYGGYPKTEGDQGQHLPPDHLSSDHLPSDHLPSDATDASGQRMTVTPELLGLMPSNATSHYSSDTDSLSGTPGARKLWTDEDMDKALDALRNAAMSLSKAAHVYGIPATTLWQRAHRMGIETPKKEGPNKTWSEHDLAGALEELRTGRMSANRASKEFGIPNSTLYKIARKEGIKLSSPFSAIQPSWNPDDLTKALEAIRGGMSVQKAAQEFGIPTGTLYGRCRREGIELSKYQGVPWSEEDMKDALEAVRVGEMSINQAAIHFNLPYSSLYGRFKRGKYEDGLPHQDFLHQEMTVEHYPADPQQPAQNPQQPPQPPQQQQHTPPPQQQQQQQQLTPGPPSEQY